MTTITDPDTGAAFDAPVTRHDDVGQAGEIARLRAENERLRAVLESADVFCSGIICFRGMTSEIETAAMRSEIRAALKETSHD